MALTKLTFDPIDGWNDTIEFPENPDDSQVRPLLQKLHDETKAYLNNVLTAEIEGTMATKAELAGVVAGGIPDGTITVEKLAFDPTEQPEFDVHIADYVRNPGYALSTGSLNAYAIAVTPAITSYIDGMSFKVKWHLANTAASSLNVCGIGPIPILDSKGNVLTVDKLKTVSTVVYYNGNFILQGEGGDVLTGDMVAGDLRSGKTGYGNDPLTKIIGTMDLANKIASNIKAGVTIDGTLGTFAGNVAYGEVTSNSSGDCNVSGLTFVPKIVIWWRKANLASTENNEGGFGFNKNAFPAIPPPTYYDTTYTRYYDTTGFKGKTNSFYVRTEDRAAIDFSASGFGFYVSDTSVVYKYIVVG